MSNYYDKNICCPKCWHYPILAMDNTPKRHQYTYGCKCGYESQEYSDFPSTVDLLDKQVKELRRLIGRVWLEFQTELEGHFGYDWDENRECYRCRDCKAQLREPHNTKCPTMLFLSALDAAVKDEKR